MKNKNDMYLTKISNGTIEKKKMNGWSDLNLSPPGQTLHLSIAEVLRKVSIRWGKREENNGKRSKISFSEWNNYCVDPCINLMIDFLYNDDDGSFKKNVVFEENGMIYIDKNEFEKWAQNRYGLKILFKDSRYFVIRE